MVHLKVSKVTAFLSGDISADLFIENHGPGDVPLGAAGYGFSIVDKAGKKFGTKPKYPKALGMMTVHAGSSHTIHVLLVADLGDFSQEPDPLDTFELVALGPDLKEEDRVKFRFHPLYQKP